MMHNDHMIAQCGWQSAFDEQTKAVDLQNFISRWSNSVLVDELDQYFTQVCPVTQTWRIEKLHLDLGEIELDDLPTELPKRLRAGLDDAFARLLKQQRLSIGTANYNYLDQYADSKNAGSNLHIIDHRESLLNCVSWFLLNGNLPWWYKGSANAVQILTEQIDQYPQATLNIIHKLGKMESVRRRIVWQFGESLVRKLVHLLEPWQGGFICAYVDNLCDVQVQKKIPTNNIIEFKHHTWVTILTYLLVDRGTLFNTIAFVRSTLWKTAQRYQIDYQQLLAQLSHALEGLEQAGLVTPVFLTALRVISKQDQIDKNNDIIREQTPIDYWGLMQQMLHYGKAWQAFEHHGQHQDTIRIDELFTALAGEDAERMARLLRHEGKSDGVRKKLLQHFSATELALVVKVVVPNDYLFVLAHVDQTQSLVIQQTGDQKIIWKVLLAYLFVDRGSYFNRRQFVYDTLIHVCNLQQLDYQLFLGLLIHTTVQHPDGHRFELLAILQDLQAEVERRQASTDKSHPYWNAVHHYLLTGKQASSQTAIGRMEDDSILFYGLIKHTKEFLSSKNSGILGILLSTPDLSSISNHILSHRLVQLIRPTDLRLLFASIQGDASEFCMSLLRNLLRWHRQASLPSLTVMHSDLPEIIVQALIISSSIRTQTKKYFNLAVFWKAFTSLLQQYKALDVNGFQQELADVISGGSYVSPKNNPAVTIINAAPDANQLQKLLVFLSTVSTSNKLDVRAAQIAEINEVEKFVEKHASLNIVQRLDKLREALIRKPVEQDLIKLWLSITDNVENRNTIGQKKTFLRSWLNQQSDKNQLIKALVSYRHIEPINAWLLAQLPVELNPPEEILTVWRDLLLGSGSWQGASAVLQYQLQDIFWNLIFSESATSVTADQYLARMFTLVCMRLDIDLNDCITRINRDLPPIKKSRWQDVNKLFISNTSAIFSQQKNIAGENKIDKVGVIESYNFLQDFMGNYLSHSRFDDIFRSLLQEGQLPQGVVSQQAVELDRLLFDVFSYRPENLPAFLSDLLDDRRVMFRLLNLVPFSWLVNALRKISPHNPLIIISIERFYKTIQQTNLLTEEQRLGVYFQLILKRFVNKDWSALAPEKLVNDYCWRLMQQYGLSKVDLQQAFAEPKERATELLQLALFNVLEKEYASTVEPALDLKTLHPSTPKKIPNSKYPAYKPQPLLVPVKINNAGLVILQSFISPLFSRLGLVSEGKFVTHSARRRAVHYLQYLVSGCCSTAEQNLMLNKLLCGLALYEPVEYEIEIPPVEQEICHSLLESVIAYWSAIGSSSCEGFRGNWLVRDGSLTEAKDRWDLIVDRRAYDVLLARSPFSYSIIKLPWMEKPIYVTWPT